MAYDCFLSHQHEDLPLVEAIAEKLEARGLKCWYAPRNVRGRYAKAIADGINQSKVFVLILNSRSAVSEPVLNEVELAHNASKNGENGIIQPVCVEPLDLGAEEYQEMMYYIRRRHFIDVCKDPDPSAIADALIRTHDLLAGKTQRDKSQYVVQGIEDQRLAIQNNILKRFDHDVYLRLIQQYQSLRVLDVGCGQGDMLIAKLKDHQDCTLIGVDRSQVQIRTAQEKHRNPNYDFYVDDVESGNFEAQLQSKMDERGIRGFELINVSMVLLHICDMAGLLAKLRRFLTEDGSLIIRDIDDGINFASPDPENHFQRIYRMCARDEQSGNRENGRQIYTALYNGGYSNIRLERQGLSTDGMTPEEKEAVFNMYFPFTLENAKIMMEKYPWNQDCKKDYLWYEQCFDSIRRRFLEPEFIFSLGFMTYTAGK